MLLQQRVTESSARDWSLPGGGLEFGESIEACLVREMEEETGLLVEVGELLYVADRIQDGRHNVHLTFRVARRGGDLLLGQEPEVGANPIGGVQFVALDKLTEHGFSFRFQQLALAGFPDAGSYRGAIENVGL